MLAAVAYAVLNALPSTCPHDAIARSVERGLITSPSRPAIAIRVGRGLAYAGCFPFEFPGVARGTRYVFADAEGAHLRRLFVLQFEEFLPASKEVYRYDMSSAEDIGGHRFRPNTFAYSNAASAAEPNEGTLTARFLAQRGYEVPDVWMASRFVTLGGEDRKSELILFYLEPAPSGTGLGDLYHGEEPTPAWQALRASLAGRSRQAFEVVKPGPPVAAVAPPAPAEGPAGTRLILLGTRGGPRVSEGRGNPSTLLLIGGTPYVVDCGYGTSRQLAAAGVPLNQVRYVFVTHHHSDHNLEVGPLAYNAWVAGPSGRIDAYGPPGLEKMAAAFFEYMKLDIETRIVDEGRSDPRALLVAHDVAGPGVVLENAQVKVTAARVAHPMVEHAYAYRFDTKDRSVVISGDTTFSPGLVELARGADVLVHEVLYPPGVEGLLARVPNAARLRPHLFASHTTAEDVGRVAALAGVRTLVLTHFVPPDDPRLREEQWAEGVRKHFAGRIIVGRDLMEIPYDAKP